MKKSILVFILLFSISPIFSQLNNAFRSNYKHNHFMEYNYNNANVVESNVVNLFDEWENKNVVYMNDNIRFKLKNINIDLEKNKFIFKDDKTVYFYDFLNLDYVVINNKKYRTYYLEKENTKKIFEIISESKKFSLLKGYKVSYLENSLPDPFMISSDSRYKIKNKYFIRDGNKVINIKLKKKAILSLLNDKKDLITSYVNKYQLSYKDENNVKEIFNYYGRI